MSHDKVTVDEPLISTDVDNLIRTIAEKKRIPLNDLRTLCRIDKKTMDKWIAVLEDEGYISVEYGLRGTYVNWCEEVAAAKAADEAQTSPPQPPSAPEEPEAKEAQEKEEIKPEPVEFKETAPMEESESETKVSEADSQPEELLSQYLARKMKGDSSEDQSLKSKILTSFGDEPSKSEEANETEDEGRKKPRRSSRRPRSNRR